MIIDVKNQLNEKQSKELLSSLKRIIAFTFKTFENKTRIDRKSRTLSITFDNGDLFVINTLLKNNNIINSYAYYNRFDDKLKEIPLQSALNINKYSLEIEQNVTNNKNNIQI